MFCIIPGWINNPFLNLILKHILSFSNLDVYEPCPLCSDPRFILLYGLQLIRLWLCLDISYNWSWLRILHCLKATSLEHEMYTIMMGSNEQFTAMRYLVSPLGGFPARPTQISSISLLNFLYSKLERLLQEVIWSTWKQISEVLTEVEQIICTKIKRDCARSKFWMEIL